MNAARRKQLKAIDLAAIRSMAESIQMLLEDARSEVEVVRDEEQEAYDNLPESLQQAERGETMSSNLDVLNELAEALDTRDLDEIVSAIENFENAEF